MPHAYYPAMAKKQVARAHVDLDRARALWCAKQGLGPRVAGKPARVVSQTGWVRTLGGVDVYLAVRARCPSLRRADLDRAVDRGELHVSPAARGCIYLVPIEHRPLALSFARALWQPRTDRELGKVGLKWPEVEDLADALVAALAGGSLTTAALRKALPNGAVRSLGAAGKKVGLSSPLPVALRLAEFQGRIERTLEDGRLDTERYHWRAAGNGESGAASAKFADPAARNAALASHFFAVAGPATIKQFATWAGLPQRDAKAAVGDIDAVPVAVEGFSPEAWLPAGDLDALRDAEPAPATPALLPFEDNLITVHGGPAVHADPAHHDLPVDSWGGTRHPVTLGTARHIGHRTIVSSGRVIGFWEYDISAGRVVSWLFDAVGRADRKALDAECEAIAGFLRDDVGHARSFSLDTDEAVQKRANAVARATSAGLEGRSAEKSQLRRARSRRTGGKKTTSSRRSA